MEKTLYAAIADSDVDSNEALLGSDAPNKPSNRRSTLVLMAFHGLLLTVNCFILIVMYMLINYRHPLEFRDLDTSIAADVIKFETRYYPHLYNASLTSPYVGKPRKELQKAWHELQKFSDVAIPEQVMADLGRLDEGVRLPDGTGYLGTLNVYHELHCINQMYRWLYKDIYLPGLTPEEESDQVGHLEHCLEGLREGAKCNADLSIVTMRWGHRQPVPLANWNSPHVCKNWEAIQEWSEEHSIPHLKDPGWLVHPTLGPAYANVSRLGVAHDN